MNFEFVSTTIMYIVEQMTKAKLCRKLSPTNSLISSLLSTAGPLSQFGPLLYFKTLLLFCDNWCWTVANKFHLTVLLGDMKCSSMRGFLFGGLISFCNFQDTIVNKRIKAIILIQYLAAHTPCMPDHLSEMTPPYCDLMSQQWDVREKSMCLDLVLIYGLT